MRQTGEAPHRSERLTEAKEPSPGAGRRWRCCENIIYHCDVICATQCANWPSFVETPFVILCFCCNAADMVAKLKYLFLESVCRQGFWRAVVACGNWSLLRWRTRSTMWKDVDAAHALVNNLLKSTKKLVNSKSSKLNVAARTFTIKPHTHFPIIIKWPSQYMRAVAYVYPRVSEGGEEGLDFEIWIFQLMVKKKNVFLFRVGKIKFHHCCPPLEKSLWPLLDNSPVGPPWKKLPTPMHLSPESVEGCYFVPQLARYEWTIFVHKIHTKSTFLFDCASFGR